MTRKAYVQRLLRAYTLLPHTPQRPRPADRVLATELFDQHIPLHSVQAAFLLASVRRIYRPQDAPSLSTIRSLHYFLPVLEEVLEQDPPLHPAYIGYLRDKLQDAGVSVANLKQIGPDPQLSTQGGGDKTR